ncbi:MAG: hypothetical protein JWM75_2578 [Sphingomonas bacterium]|nr:hypothetical protein [Sphingomonas bacterium]
MITTSKFNKIGDASTLSADQARKVAQRVKAQALMGESPQEKRKVRRQVPTLAELAPRYLEHVRGYKRVPEIDERYLRWHLLPRFGKLHLDELKQAEIVDWLNGKVKEGCAQATVNRWQIILPHLLRLAGEWGIPGAERNPLKGAKLRDPNNKKERFLSAEEIGRLRAAVEQSPNPLLAPIVTLLLRTGCRKRELLDATWDQFDRERKSWRIPMSKSGKARHVPLSDEAIKVLEALPQLCKYVVPNVKTLKPHGSIFSAWNTARRRAGLKDCRIHDLRHALASHLAMSGHSILLISKVLGHSSTKTTERYSHLSGETLGDAVNTAAKVSGTTWATPTYSSTRPWRPTAVAEGRDYPELFLALRRALYVNVGGPKPHQRRPSTPANSLRRKWMRSFRAPACRNPPHV